MAALNAARWAELVPQVDELLALESAERERRLGEIAANDPATASQLRSLLEARDAASRVSFLGGVAEPTLLPPSVAAGDTLGAWTLVDVIGEGGMGSVWRARRSDGRFEGEAAIKLLRSGVFDAGAQERFRREGAILARLRHPGIAQLLDAGVTGRGQPYLVLEFVEGERIDLRCNRLALDVRERVSLFVQVLAAVSAAHAQLVVHRDLKPSNILVDDTGRVRLLDFGIAQLQSDDAGPGLTREGALALTPEYAAPEQSTGGVIGVATDVYALGVVLYELLTGVHPSGLQGAPALAYLKAASESGFKLASEAATERRRELRGDLDNILAKALRAAPEERYTSVAALGDDLRRFLEHEPVSARPDAFAYRTGKLLRRHRLASALAALATVATLAGISGTLVQAQRATRAAELARTEGKRALEAASESDRQRALAQEQTVLATQAATVAAREHHLADARADDARKAALRAEHERDRTLHELDFAESTSQLMIYLLGDAGDKPFTTSELLARAADTIDRQYQADPEQHARLLALVAFQYTQSADTARAKPLLDRAYTLAREAGSVDTVAALDCQLALNGYQSTPAPALIAMIDKAISTLSASSDQGGSTLANCLTARSLLHRVAGDPAAALADAERSLALFGHVRAGQRLSAMSARSARATALGQLGRWSEGVAEYRTIVAELQAMGQGETVKATTNIHNLASQLANAGQVRESAQYSRQSLDLQERMGSDNDASTWTLYADMLSRMGDTEALAATDKALAAAARRGTPGAMGNAAAGAATVYCRLEFTDRCEASLAQARKALDPLLTPAHQQRANFDVLLARLAVLRGQDPEALKALERALPIYEKARIPGPGLMHALLLYAQVLRGAGRAQMAREILTRERALAERFSTGFPTSEHRGDADSEEARLRLAEGRREDALDAAKNAVNHYVGALGPNASRTLAARAFQASLEAN